MPACFLIFPGVKKNVLKKRGEREEEKSHEMSLRKMTRKYIDMSLRKAVEVVVN